MKTLEIIEVVVLAIVAIATAWSGYQATKWDGQQLLVYGQASRDRFQADAASTYGGQLVHRRRQLLHRLVAGALD